MGAKPLPSPSVTPLSRGAAYSGLPGKKESNMKHFGTVESFDESKGRGLIKPEQGDKSISFDRSAFAWDNKSPPPMGQRLSYDLRETEGEARAVNLQNA